MNYCLNCGCKLPQNAKFCGECGCPLPDDTNTSQRVGSVVAPQYVATEVNYVTHNTIQYNKGLYPSSTSSSIYPQMTGGYSSSSGSYPNISGNYPNPSRGQQSSSVTYQSSTSNVQRQEGNCPSCGSLISSFSTMCPYCGREIGNNTAYATACQELCDKLEEIEASRPKATLLTTINGLIDKATDNVTLNNTDKRKLELIGNFVVPNNKSDILEFLMLSETRIEGCNRLKNSTDDEYVKSVQKQMASVWESKRDQILIRAETSLGRDPEFLSIKNSIQMKKNKEAGRCQYCGASFRGIINKVCSACGRPKDY